MPLDKFASGGEISEEDKVVYHMPPEEKDRIQKLIKEYDVRLPFDEKNAKKNFALFRKR